jgi:glycosyltransferase involved in cell wall biosynthesis
VTSNANNEDSQSTDLVSVIIPAYNMARYIGETLDSVIAQSYPHFEIIIVNDGSPDTPELETVLLPYRDKIVYLTQENRGLAGARNTGLRAATGRLVALLDADDIWLPNYLEEQVRFLRENPDKHLVYCDAEFFGEGITPGQYYMRANPNSGEATAEAIISKHCTVFVSVTARTAVLRELGFDESLRSCEDFDCWIRMTASGYKIGYQRKVLARYRRHAASLSANPTRMGEFNLKVLNKALNLFPQGSVESLATARAIEKKHAEIAMINGKLALLNRDSEAAVRHFTVANKYYHSGKTDLLIKALKYAPDALLGLYLLRGRIWKKYQTVE